MPASVRTLPAARPCTLSLLILGSAILGSSAAANPQSELLIDVNEGQIGPSSFSGSDPFLVSSLDGGLLMRAETRTIGEELWFSDGTAPGTRLACDLTFGQNFDGPGRGASVADGSVLFGADSTFWGEELFRFNPTTGAVNLVRDIFPGPGVGFSFGSSEPQLLFSWQGEVWFLANDGVHGNEWWRSDGTGAGTRLVADLAPGSSWFGNFQSRITATDNALYLISSSSLTPIYVLSSPDAVPQPIQAGKLVGTLGSTFFFAHDDGVHGNELWSSDGTPAGTQLFADLEPGPGSSSPAGINNDGQLLWFSATVGDRGNEPFRTDGTVAGTFALDEIVPGPESGLNFNTFGAAAFGGVVTAASFAGGQRPWFIGPDPGTSVELGVMSGSFGYTFFQDRVYFSASDFGVGRELFETDGTVAGTDVALDLEPGSGGSDCEINGVTSVGLLITADINDTGDEPYVVKGDPLFAVSLGDLNQNLLPYDSTPSAGVRFENELYFSAQSNFGNFEAYVTDGSPSGSAFFADVPPAPFDSEFDPVLDVNGRLLFMAKCGEDAFTFEPNCVQLMTTDGTAASIEQLIPTPDEVVVLFGDGVVHRGVGYIVVNRSDTFISTLYRTDGTVAGTTPIVDVDATNIGGSLIELVPFAGDLWFRARDTFSNAELWRTDGTAEGTGKVAEIFPGSIGSNPSELTVVGERLFFNARSESLGNELFVTDAEGNFEQLTDIWPGVGSSNPRSMMALGELLLFFAADANNELHLYTSDGTVAGTQLLPGLPPGPLTFQPDFAQRVDDRIVFTLGNVTTGFEIWATDGTAAGTQRVADSTASGKRLTLDALVPLGSGRQFLVANYDIGLGLEWFKGDLDSPTVGLIENLFPGPESAQPYVMGRVGDHFVFAANNGIEGEEPHAFSIAGQGGYVAESFGSSCSDTLIGFEGRARLGELVDVTLESIPLTAACVFASSQRNYTPIAGSCASLIGPTPKLFASIMTDDSGQGARTFSIPNDPALVGAELSLQWAVIDSNDEPATLLLSDGLELVIGA